MEMHIGANIRRLRHARGMTQEELAGRLNVSTAAVSKWEARGSYPDMSLLGPLALLFGVSTDELLGYDEVQADCLCSTYGRERPEDEAGGVPNPAAWEADRLLHSPHPGMAALRDDPAYVAMLRRFAAPKGELSTGGE